MSSTNNTNTRNIPDHLHAAYDWVNAAGEIETLAAMNEAQADAYAATAAANAAEHDASDVTEADLCALWRRIRTV